MPPLSYIGNVWLLIQLAIVLRLVCPNAMNSKTDRFCRMEFCPIDQHAMSRRGNTIKELK